MIANYRRRHKVKRGIKILSFGLDPAEGVKIKYSNGYILYDIRRSIYYGRCNKYGRLLR